MPIEYPDDEMVSLAKNSSSSLAAAERLHATAAVKYSKDIENILVESFGASGIGLHEKISSVEHALPQGMKIKLRAVATIHYEVVHAKYLEISYSAAHEAQCREALTDLRALSGEGRGWKLGGFIFLGISGLAGFSIGVRNFGLGAGIAFATLFTLYCAWILWPKVLREAFCSKQEKP
ncbi:hypothetical protein [Herminiimonas aquatilis]|uniref:Uncharacterized protein n=1 Tax=Herminiimonas aquatilis TaxID=345342 RepID=A0ABW2J2X1_9BURK